MVGDLLFRRREQDFLGFVSALVAFKQAVNIGLADMLVQNLQPPLDGLQLVADGKPMSTT
jgi:hypothetical protein